MRFVKGLAPTGAAGAAVIDPRLDFTDQPLARLAGLSASPADFRAFIARSVFSLIAHGGTFGADFCTGSADSRPQRRIVEAGAS